MNAAVASVSTLVSLTCSSVATQSAAPACQLSDFSRIGDHADGVREARNTTSPFCEQTTVTWLHVSVVEIVNVIETPTFGWLSPLPSVTMANAIREMLLTGPDV